MSVKQTNTPKFTPAAGVVYGFDTANTNQTNALKINSDGSQLIASAPGSVITMHADGTALKIANGASLSGAIDLGPSQRLCRIVAPAAWTAAALTFQVSYDGSTWFDLYDESGNEVSYTLTVGKSMRVPFADWIGVRYLKIRSGTNGSPVNQSADRVFSLVTA